MWRTSSGLFFLLCLVSLTEVSGQGHANSWIDYNQEYYKIKVAEDGLYRITATELAAAGVPVGTVAASAYQLYRRGVEVAITVNDGNADGRLDYLEFYGQKNDGTGDTDLYREPAAQPHTLHSLFADTAVYFLTWTLTPEPVRRMQLVTYGDTTGLTPDPWHVEQDLKLQVSGYKTGLRHGSTNELLSAEYDYGEGWAGANISKNGTQSFSFTLQNTNQSGVKPNVEVLLFGINNLEHLVDISVGPDASSLRSIGQASFEKQYTYLFGSAIEWTDVGASGQLVVKVTALGVSGQAEQVAVGYVRCSYPQELVFAAGENSKQFYLPAHLVSEGYAVVSTTAAASCRVFDVTSPLTPVRITKRAVTSRLEFIYPNATTDRAILVVGSHRSAGSIEKVPMKSYDVAASNYLIISHPVLNALTDGVNPVSEYVAYRQSISGGDFDVLHVEIGDLFNQFNYGDPSPLAIRKFIKYALALGNPEHLFLIGKGTTPNYNYYRANPATTSLVHFVPTFGYPGSDVMLSVNVAGSTIEPAISTGRLNAYTARDVKAYLDKVKEMEALAYDQLWRKNLLQLSGGATAGERNSFATYIGNFKVMAEGDYLGGKATNVNKKTNDAVQVINVAGEINAGVGMVTFFGHSSGQVTDIEIGKVSSGNNLFGYANKGKYPVFLINGCNAGEIFTGGDGSTLTFGEDWLHTPDLGGIGFIANSDFALSSSLRKYTDQVYRQAFQLDDDFGMSVGEILKRVSKSYFDIYGNDLDDKAQVYLTILQGDPAIRIFGAQSPDYEIRSEEVFASAFDQGKVLANVDSFKLNLVVRNFGRTVDDSLGIQVRRTLGDGSQKSYFRKFPRVLRHDTLQFVIRNELQEVNEGTNVFVIQLDHGDSVSELNELNNSASFELFIPKGNTINLYPINLATLNNKQVEFVWQSAGQLRQDRAYSLEIDTTSTFSSPFRLSESRSGNLLMRYSRDFTSLQDSVTIYWRTRFASPEPGEDTTWVHSSFTFTPSVFTGWGQIGKGQFEEATMHGVDYHSAGKRWTFQETSTPIEVNTHGVNNPGEYADYLVLIDGINFLATTNLADPECKKKNAINAVVFGKENAQPYSPYAIGQDVFNDLVCGRIPQLINNFDENDVLGANRYLDSLISMMETGDMILLFSFDSVAYSNWDAQLISSLGEVGIQSSTIAGLTDGQPLIFLGRKGDPEGAAVEITSDGSGLPAKGQAISLVANVTGKFNSGSITSPKVGPAKTWNEFVFDIDDEPNDNIAFHLIGYDRSGQQEYLLTQNRFTRLDISQVDAGQYPYLQVNLNFSDDTDLTPPRLNAWGINYELPPEAMLSTGLTSTVQVQEGETFSGQFYFTSLSDLPFTDSTTVEYTVTNVQSGEVETRSMKILPPFPNDTTAFEIPIDTRGKTGENNLLVKVTAGEQELYIANNILNIESAFSVSRDETNPVLDVTFDGSYILNGDIVSPSPSIRMRLKDENPYLFKNDTSGIRVELKRSCEGCAYERVSFSDPKISYTPASEEQDFEVTYLPGPLEDGIYMLRVQGTDESGNASGQQPYEVSFEVINESTITHFYPYPNPFSTSTRFVFTLTGSTIPDEIKIRIMTVSGRVVREITREEIGPIRIGNNITQYAWNGRDEYGDQLANGVYLYKVFIQQNGEMLKHRNTNADRAFKNGFGKLYILR